MLLRLLLCSEVHAWLGATQPAEGHLVVGGETEMRVHVMPAPSQEKA